MRRPEHPGPRQRTQAYLAVVRDEEVLRWLLLEPLQAAPRHVLDHQQRAVSNEDHVERPVADDRPIEPLNYAWQDAQPARQRIVFFQHAAGALRPRLNRGVDGGLYVRPVEIDLCAFGQVVKGAGEAEDVPEQRAGGGDLVDVKARVDE
ncbi:MAG: hypothetical protein Q9214_003193 [Letrouitia sp. 1 TL-2023]